MPLNFIPNQPFIFEQPIGDYPCLNNDDKAYAQLVQDGDVTCVQWILDACDEPLCEPDMEGTAGADELGSWTATGGWSSTGSDNLEFDGTGNPSGDAQQSLSGLTVGAVYRLTFDVTAYTGIVDYSVAFTGSSSATIDATGSYTLYFIASSATVSILIGHNGTSSAADTLEIENLEAVQWTTCWVDDIVFLQASWSYEFDGANGRFCSVDQTNGDLVNTTAFTTTGNYHGVEFTIDNCTAGGVEVYLGSVLLGTTSGNGVFSYYGIPTAGTDLVFTKVDNFNGCISQVTVFDYGDVSTAAVTVRSNDNFYKADALTPTPFEDRLIQCIDWETLSWNMNGTPTDCIPLRVDIKDPCDNNVLYISVNRALYRSGGAEWECTKMVESWNDGFAFGFYFGDIAAPDFVLRQRLRVLAFNPVYRNAGEEYLYSSGNTGRSFAQSQKARTAWFDYMDEYAHDCTRTQLLGQKLLIDGYAFYYPTEDYEPEWNERGAYNLAQSRVTVFHEEAIFGSTCGTMANAVCPPQVVPVPVPAELNEVIVLVDTLNISPIDQFSVLFTDYYWGTTGVPSQGAGGGPYDLTDGIQRAAFATDIANLINVTYPTSTTSTSCTIAGTNLNLTVICSGTISIPMQGFSIAIYSAGQIAIPLPITFA